MRGSSRTAADVVDAFVMACALLVCGSGLACAAAPAMAANGALAQAPAEVARAMPAAQLIGTATLQYVGFDIYEARLWATPGFAAERYPTQVFALELRYARSLERGAITLRSLTEMRRVGSFDQTQERAWRDQLSSAIPDVDAGDRLTGVRDGRGATHFFANGRPTAVIADPEFGRLFFGIWLSPQTSEPALRRDLIGQPP